MLVFGARPKAPDTIPRYWWPITFFLIEAGAFLYWCAMVVTWVEVGSEKNRRTIGEIIGFKVNIYNETDITLPETLQEDMMIARLDGSRRRLGYEVCLYMKFSLHTSEANKFSSMVFSRVWVLGLRRPGSSLASTCTNCCVIYHLHVKELMKYH
jgi:hypothetical protein